MGYKAPTSGDIIEKIKGESWLFGILNNQLYVWNKTYWKSISSEMGCVVLRKCILSEEDAINVSTNTLNEVIKRLKQLDIFCIPEQDLAPAWSINCNNGFIDLRDGMLHRMEDYPMEFLYVNDFEYVSDATIEQAPNFQYFCQSSLYDDEEKRKLLLQMLGYLISDLDTVKAAFFLIGESNSGKSLILELLQMVLGDDAVTNIPFGKLGNRFNKAKLIQSRVNICTEIEGGKMKDIDFFKAVTAHERITAENKGEPAFEFRVRTKLISAGNVLPSMPEITGSSAILKRMIVLRFNKSISEKDIDRTLLEKMIREKNIIFSLAVKELMILMKNNFHFIEPVDSRSFMQIMQETADAVDEFVNLRCYFGVNAKVHLVTLWDAFEKFCGQNGYEIKISKIQFSQKIASYQGVTRRKLRIMSEPLAGFEGIALAYYGGKIPENNKQN